MMLVAVAAMAQNNVKNSSLKEDLHFEGRFMVAGNLNIVITLVAHILL